ncbi:hypothetical protein [Alienimonas chondri]|uniref:Uncharacterized protein n=1 Tax=Alienimonas chondri TaxID=2681879 RepID=A0ABX1VH12_9PLAN|nr:hypothetical protein [Alienimonas chondri]NNJ26537.1 hypothetical protein [Alienimonas chondri]
MIALEVSKNGERVCIAGAEDLGVLAAHVSAVGRLGTATVPIRPDEGEPHIHFSVSGLTRRADPNADVHPRWQGITSLAVGDEITVRVLETDVADPAVSEAPAKCDPENR